MNTVIVILGDRMTGFSVKSRAIRCVKGTNDTCRSYKNAEFLWSPEAGQIHPVSDYGKENAGASES
ncbi:MAG: hypothetical protein KKH95_01830, partial [Gammaproteobacteria bacterium]|nr:hypothetical protein [Gammaproteobacteria bacterium]